MTGHHWQFGLLGPLRIQRGGEDVVLPGVMPRTLLGLLLAGGGNPQPADVLIDRMWADRAPAQVQSSFHVHLSKVRKALGPALVKAEGGYLIDPSAYELDTDRFRTLVEAAAAQVPEEAGVTLRHALELWRGTPFADLPENAVLEQWARELEEARLDALLQRVDADLAAGADRELLGELQRLSAAHPYEERIAGQLMLALYRAGRQADALTAYDRARRQLLDELGLEPGLTLKHLQEAILLQDPSLTPARASVAASPAAPAPAPPPPSDVRVRLPRPLTRLIGRDRDLEELTERAQAEEWRLITLAGPGGVGKTRLGLEYALRTGPTMRDGATFVALGELTEPAQVRSEIAAAIARDNASAEPTEATLADYLAARQLLLVLDNFEHVVDAAPLVSELLQEAPELRVLVTSRVPLRIRGEHLFEVTPLGVSDGADPSGPALDLFLQSAYAIRRDLEMTPQTREMIADICRGLDGLPLAIELAAARVGMLQVAEIHAAVARPLDLAGGGFRDLPERQRSLDATIGWSYALLSDSARAVLSAAGVFRGSFSAEALAAVCDAPVIAAVAELTEANLMQLSRLGDRYVLLSLIRSFCTEQLAADPERSAELAERHCRYFADRYGFVIEDRRPADIGATARQRAIDHADLLAAADHAIAVGDAALALPILLALQPSWMTGYLAESVAIMERALEGCRFRPEDELQMHGIVVYANAYRPEGEIWARRMMQRASELGITPAVVSAGTNLISMAMDRRDWDAVLAYRDELLAISTSEDDLPPGLQVARTSTLAVCSYLEGDMATAETYADIGMARAAHDVHPHAAAGALLTRVMVASGAGRAVSAAELRDLVAAAIALELPDLGVGVLWIVARYAAASDPMSAAELLGLAEQHAMAGDLYSWPEVEFRDETLSLLGADAGALAAHYPPRTLAQSLTRAADWLAGRPADEAIIRERVATAKRT